MLYIMVIFVDIGSWRFSHFSSTNNADIAKAPQTTEL